LSFFKELKRRNVIRVAIAYAVAAWLLIEITATTFPILKLPDWSVTLVTVLVLIGFPLALILAWAFELTPEGLKKEKDVVRSESITHVTGRKLDFAIIAALAAALVFFAGTHQWSSEIGHAEIADKSIAVLPFVNMSDDTGNEYFSEGLSEELLNLLVKIPELRVAARTSSFSYKGKDVNVTQIGEELNVTHVLEGSVRKAGNHVRITAQLVKADDGFHLWSETFDRTLDDIFVIQDEIAKAVVDELKISLLGAMPEGWKTVPEVYSLYLQGKYFNNLRGEENLEKAVAVFKQALAIDPDYAPAWVGISFTYSLQIFHGLRSEEESLTLALEAIESALAIDEHMATAWSGLAYLRRTYKWDWQGAKFAINKALQLEPNNVDVVGSAATLAGTFGRLSESIELFEQNVALDPLRLSSLRALGIRYVTSGRIDDAFEVLHRVQALNPNYPSIHSDLARAYLFKGDLKNALLEVEKSPDRTFYANLKARIHFTLGNEAEAESIMYELLETSAYKIPISMAATYAWRGENDSAFEWLEMAYQQHDYRLVYFLGNIWWRNLTTDPRYPVFVEKLGLLEEWKAMPPEYGGPSKPPPENGR
jgi:TolB-like protein/Tfp pilus assembly protein PilF